jgi:predicted dehydrogenase
MTGDIRLGLVGFGKIAREEHLPAIAATPGARLIAVASRNARADGFAHYPDLESMLVGEPDINAVALCQPPQVRYDSARMALQAGKHVFLEKPPGATLSEVATLVHLAKAQGVTLYASWHSRHAMGVDQAQQWCANNQLRKVTITWKEDVRRWHPGQDWIWEAGGFGVFDPGINALSILTKILKDRVRLIDAALHIPANRNAPIAAELSMATAGGVPVTAEFDWRHIRFEGENGDHLFSQGGDVADDAVLGREYHIMYRHFVQLVRTGHSDVDMAPLTLVADAFMRGTIDRVEAFED